MKLRTVVVDDEDLARHRVRDLAEAHGALEVVGEAAHGAEALDVLTALRPDLVFLDIQMPEADGFQVLGALDGDVRPAVVFVTAYDAYAIQAFEVGAFDYLLKPVTAERFGEAVARILARLPLGDPSRRPRALAADVERERGWARRLVARSGNRHYFIPVSAIRWVESDGNYLRVRDTAGREHLVRRTMKEIQGRLDPARFTRIHRSTLVAIDRIASIRSGDNGEWEVHMEDGARLATSRSYAANVRALMR